MKIKLISIFLIIIIISMLVCNVSTASINITSADLYSTNYFHSWLKLEDIVLECNYVAYTKDGVEYPAYCLQRDLAGVKVGEPYSVSVDSLISNVMVWRTIINGYPYKTYSELGCNSKEEAFFATKQAVYCILYNREPSAYTAITEEGTRCLAAMKQIVNSAKSSTQTKISSDLVINEENTKWQIDDINKEYISKTYLVSANSTINKYTIKLEGKTPEGTKIVDISNAEKTIFDYGEKFKIIIPLKNIEKDGNFNICAEGKVNTKPILYGKSANSTTQDYALTGSSYEDGSGTLTSYYSKNETGIIIIKKDSETSQVLQGAKFELLNERQDIVYSDLETDSEGKIEIKNLIPGIYYVKETKTVQGYSIYNKLIKIELVLNETATAIINNSKEDTKIEKDKKETIVEVENSKSITKVTSNKTKLPKTGN